MISETYWTMLENANRQLALRFEKLKKARAAGDREGIAHARMAYLQALQILYTEAQAAVSEAVRFKA